MSTFMQITAMQKLTETLARMDLPHECQDDRPADPVEAEAITRALAIADAGALYDMIETARQILKAQR